MPVKFLLTSSIGFNVCEHPKFASFLLFFKFFSPFYYFFIKDIHLVRIYLTSCISSAGNLKQKNHGLFRFFGFFNFILHVISFFQSIKKTRFTFTNKHKKGRPGKERPSLSSKEHYFRNCYSDSHPGFCSRV